MSVVGANTKLLFCEGKPYSLDRRMLDRLLIGRSGILVVPAGGKHGLRAFIDGYTALPQANYPFVAFRDRDFDAVPSPTPSLIRLTGAKPIFLSHRACIESYLLDPALIDDYWNANRAFPAWKHGVSPGTVDLAQWIEDAAREITAYQAVRWGLSSMKPGERWPEVRTCWTSGSGHLPASVVESDCVAAAKSLLAQFSSETGSVTDARFVAAFHGFQSQFSARDFWTNRDYAVWFHGKDLKSSMQRLRMNSISMDHFCLWAVDHFGWSAHADLQEILTHI